MRFSNLFGKTARQMPAETESISHQLLLKSGMIAQEAAGIYSYLPLGWKVLQRIEAVVRDEMNKAGGQEVLLPALQPFSLWEKTGRNVSFGESLFCLTDRKKHKLVLGPTHEEVVINLVRRYVQSYRDLPVLLYQLQTKFRDELRPRGGLLRVREFIMKDLYSFDTSEEGLAQNYERMTQAYKNLYASLGLPVLMVEADSGAIGGKDSHEFIVITDNGEDEVIHCPQCNYAANVEKAHSFKEESIKTPPLPLQEIATPEVKTIEEVAEYVGVPARQTLKSVFYIADGEFIFVVIRGDTNINETKLKNVLQCSTFKMATEAEVVRAGLVSGSASPIGIKKLKIVGDSSIASGTNFVTGANKQGYHFQNANCPRDFQVDLLKDIALAQAGDNCPFCKGKLLSCHGIEVGHIFKLGTSLSEKLGAFFQGEDGSPYPIVMGCYGIGIGRLLASVVEKHHDDKGIIWPSSISPYQVHFCPLHINDPEISSIANKIYKDLQENNVTVLFDDREESPGVKFNDADLLGIPLRLTLSPRTLQKQEIEIKWRTQKQASTLPLQDYVKELKALLKENTNDTAL